MSFIPLNAKVLVSISRSVAFVSFLAVCALATPAPVSPENPTPLYASIYVESSAEANRSAVLAAYPPSALLGLETPIAIRNALIGVSSSYELESACHPTALDFFGRRLAIPSAFCVRGSDERAIVNAALFYHAMRVDFPDQARGWADYVRRESSNIGMDPPLDFVRSNSTDMSTPLGWATVFGSELADYFANDGWNSRGDRSRAHFRIPFEDYTGYQPQNRLLSPLSSEFPLRWQPLNNTDGQGRIFSQIHVVPQLGDAPNGVAPLVISEKDLESRKVPSPYSQPNRAGSLSEEDAVTIDKFIDEVVQTTTSLTREQQFQIRYWDNKFFSLGFLAVLWRNPLQLTSTEENIATFRDMMAQHDALLAVWKEKRRHDLVRPTTMIRRRRAGKALKAFDQESGSVIEVAAKDWEPLIQIMPHSEYPSASAAICTAALEMWEALAESKGLPNGPAIIPLAPLSLPVSPLNRDESLVFPTYADVGKSCGLSRLWSGVHFSPSVPAGESIGKGIGQAAFEHVDDLLAGRIPKSCSRCKRDITYPSYR